MSKTWLIAGALATAAVVTFVGASFAADTIEPSDEIETSPTNTATADEASASSERYGYVGGDRQRAALERAVDEVVDQMNPLVRSVARRRLLEANGVIERLAFSLGGDPIVASYIGGRLVKAPADGREVPWIDQFGDEVRASHRLQSRPQGSILVQTISDDRGFRRNTYVFGEDGSLTMQVRIESSMLPAPVRYELSYRKR